MESKNTDKLHSLSAEGSEQTNQADQQHLNKYVDWLDIKRGCCGTLLIFLLIIGCLAINLVAHI